MFDTKVAMFRTRTPQDADPQRHTCRLHDASDTQLDSGAVNSLLFVRSEKQQHRMNERTKPLVQETADVIKTKRISNSLVPAEYASRVLPLLYEKPADMHVLRPGMYRYSLSITL